MVIRMPPRSTRKPKTQPDAAISHDVQATHFPAWSREEQFGGFLMQTASPVDPAQITIHIQGRALTVSFGTGTGSNRLSIVRISKRDQKAEYVRSGHRHRFILPETVNTKTTKAVWCIDTLTIRFLYTDVEASAVRFPMVDPDTAPRSSVIAIPIDFGKPVAAIIRPSDAKTHERKMADEDDRIITKQGSRYFPLSLAAERAQVPRTTLLNWLKAKVNFQGRPLQIYKSPTVHKSFLPEESVQRVAERFVKWPSQEPVGAVTIGETKDQSGYIGIAKAARVLGVDHHTMWLWTAHLTAPTDKPLDVIKCTASEQFYIRENAIAQLRKLIPKSGLRPGRRPQLAMN